MSPVDGTGGDPLSGLLAQVLIGAAVLAFPISRALLRFYRKRVVAGMRARGSSPSSPPPPPLTDAASPRLEPSDELRFTLVDSRAAAAGAGESAAPPLLTDALRASWQAATVYAVAGVAFALVMASAYVMSAGGGLRVMAVLMVTLHFAWPAVLAVNIVAAASRAERARVAGAYAVGLVALGAVGLSTSPDLTAGQLVVLWLLANGLGSLLLLAFLHRSVRAVGPLVLTFLVVALSGAVVALALGASQPAIPRVLGEIGAALRLSAPVLFVGLIVAGAAVLAPVGWALGRWLGSRYERKQISDLSVTIDAIWLLFASTHSTVLVASGGARWLLWGVGAFLVYKVAASAGFRMLRARRAGIRTCPRLLILRAFSLGKRSERLFDALGKKWRHVGSILLICGPDLATTTIEPHEFLDFLRGRLARRFVDSPETLDRRVAEIDLAPDRDGRFRVNEFFCYDDMWRSTLSRLVGLADSILLDLRGFSRQHAGLAFEIQHLVSAAPLERIVVLIDDTTDQSYVKDLAGRAWRARRARAPSQMSGAPALRLLRFTGEQLTPDFEPLRALTVASQTPAVRFDPILPTPQSATRLA